ncbi:hypothetical protein QOT17_002195 [Balamuthia mandrillaris]
MPEKQKREWDFTILVRDDLPSYPTKEELEERRSYNYALPKNFHDYISDPSPEPANDLFSSKGKRQIQASLCVPKPEEYSVGKNLRKRKERQEQLKEEQSTSKRQRITSSTSLETFHQWN